MECVSAQWHIEDETVEMLEPTIKPNDNNTANTNRRWKSERYRQVTNDWLDSIRFWYGSYSKRINLTFTMANKSLESIYIANNIWRFVAREQHFWLAVALPLPAPTRPNGIRCCGFIYALRSCVVIRNYYRKLDCFSLWRWCCVCVWGRERNLVLFYHSAFGRHPPFSLNSHSQRLFLLSHLWRLTYSPNP